MLCSFCREYGVPHRRSGKLIVAAEESEIAKLVVLEALAKANGVDDLLWLSGAEARALEPALRANRRCFRPRNGMRPRRPGARQSVRHRVPWSDSEPRDRGRDREAALTAAK